MKPTTNPTSKSGDKVSPKANFSKLGKAVSQGKVFTYRGKNVSARQKPENKARLEARISSPVHLMIKRAAEIQGRTVTDFVVQAALDSAMKTIENEQIIRLSMEGQKAFAEALLNPPEPNEALKKAFEKHAELIGNNG